MSHFEYLSAGISILFALALGRTVTAAPHLVRSSSFDPLFTFMYFVFLYWLLGLWWVLWESRSTLEWDFVGFLLLVISPLSYYLNSLVLIPNDPETVDSWADHYAQNCRLFAGLYAFTFVAGLARLFYLDLDFGWQGVIFAAPFLLLSLVCAMTTRRSLHWLLGVALIVFLTGRIYAGELL